MKSPLWVRAGTLAALCQLTALLNASAQASVPRAGEHLTDEQDVRLIASAVRMVFPTRIPVVDGRRLCRADLTDPKCPPVTEDKEGGPRISWKTFGGIARRLAQTGTEKAYKVNILVQPPLLVHDSVFMRIIVVESRDLRRGYDFVYEMVNGEPKLLRFDPIVK